MTLVSNSKHRSHAGYTQSQIVRLLQKKENERLRFTDLQKSLSISKPVLSLHLDKLEKEGTLVSIKEGREKFYMLSKNAFKRLDRRIDILSSNYNEFNIEDLLDNYDNDEEFYSRIGNRLSAWFLFSILKSIETGEPWTKSIDIPAFSIPVLFVLTNIIYKNKSPDEVHDILSDLDMEKIKKTIEKTSKKNMSENLKPLYDTLHKLYPLEAGILNFMYENPQAHWYDYLKEISNN